MSVEWSCYCDLPGWGFTSLLVSVLAILSNVFSFGLYINASLLFQLLSIISKVVFKYSDFNAVVNMVCINFNSCFCDLD